MRWICEFFWWICDHINHLISGLFFWFISYFIEIQAVVHVMWIAIALDLLSGVTASVWKRKERFSMKKFFIAIGRALIVTIFIALLYAMDKEMHQDIAKSYNVAAWIITGFYAWSFMQNSSDIFGGLIFKMINGFIEKRVEKETGVDLTKEVRES
jgi:phage-related holin